MDAQLRTQREHYHAELNRPFSYFKWAAYNKNLSLSEKVRRILHYGVWPLVTLVGPRARLGRWLKLDRRPRGYGDTKYAINRDGDLFLVICPMCSYQHVGFNAVPATFQCPYAPCSTTFRVYTEDGVIRLVDHRRGDVALPAVAVYDPAVKVYRLGVDADAPWWWKRREVHLDLYEGVDAHGHEPYLILQHGETTERHGDPNQELYKRPDR